MQCQAWCRRWYITGCDKLRHHALASAQYCRLRPGLHDTERLRRSRHEVSQEVSGSPQVLFGFDRCCLVQCISQVAAELGDVLERLLLVAGRLSLEAMVLLEQGKTLVDGLQPLLASEEVVALFSGHGRIRTVVELEPLAVDLGLLGTSELDEVCGDRTQLLLIHCCTCAFSGGSGTRTNCILV